MRKLDTNSDEKITRREIYDQFRANEKVIGMPFFGQNYEAI